MTKYLHAGKLSMRLLFANVLKLTFLIYSFKNSTRESNRSNPDWDQGLVWPYNCPHHLQCLSTYATSNVRVSDSIWRFVFNKCMKLKIISQGQHKQEISLKKIYDEVTKDI